MDLPDKPWKAMYRALLWRVTELVEDGEGWTGVDHPSITELRRARKVPHHPTPVRRRYWG